MAEKRMQNFDVIMRNLRQHIYAPIYILMGEEPYYIDKISSYIEANVLTAQEKGFNFTLLYGSDVTAANVIDYAREYPIMANNRVVIVKEAQAMHSIDLLEKYLQHPMKTTLLVICYKNGVIDKRKKLINKAEQIGVVFESNKKKDYELPAFIEKYLKANNTSINSKAAAMMVEHIGANLTRLCSEMDKMLISLTDNNKVITPEMVEQKIGVSKEFNAFELKNAIVIKDIFKANQIVNYFDKNPKAGSFFSYLPMLFNYFQNLMIAHYAPNKNNERELAAFLELKSLWAVKDYIIGMKNYSPKKTLQIIRKIRDTDAKSKGLDNKNTSVGELMKELLFFILH